MEKHFEIDYRDVRTLKDVDEIDEIGLVEGGPSSGDHSVTADSDRYVTSFCVVNHEFDFLSRQFFRYILQW